MALSHSVDEAQLDVSQKAARIANQEARIELLSGRYQLGPYLAKLSGQSLSHLQREWSPFAAYPQGRQEFGIVLKAENDPMVKALLAETQTLARAREIGREAIKKAMTSSTPFMTTLLNDLFSGGHYSEKVDG